MNDDLLCKQCKKNERIIPVDICGKSDFYKMEDVCHKCFREKNKKKPRKYSRSHGKVKA